jgi:hypothetical protein
MLIRVKMKTEWDMYNGLGLCCIFLGKKKGGRLIVFLFLLHLASISMFTRCRLWILSNLMARIVNSQSHVELTYHGALVPNGGTVKRQSVARSY